jgi:hypothetical protein
LPQALGRGGVLGDALLVAALPLSRLGLEPGLGLAQPREAAARAGELGRELVAARRAVLAVLRRVDLGGLAQDRGDLLVELGQRAVGLAGGVGGHLGPVQRHQAQADQPRFGTQPQRGDQQAGQGLLVADAESGDGHVVRGAVAGQHPEGEVLDTAPLDLPRGPHPGRIGVEEHAQQRLGVVGRVAVPVGPVGGKERAQVQLVDHVAHEPGQVVGGQPVARVGGGAGTAGRGRWAGNCRPWRMLSLHVIRSKRELFLNRQLGLVVAGFQFRRRGGRCAAEAARRRPSAPRDRSPRRTRVRRPMRRRPPGSPAPRRAWRTRRSSPPG